MNHRTTSTVTKTSRRSILVGSAGIIAAANLSATTLATAAQVEHSVSPRNGKHSMSTITTKDGTQIYYKDWGSGEPVVFSHGWPLSAHPFEAPIFLLPSPAYRCIPP